MLGGYGLLVVAMACAAWASLATWSVHDPSLNNATRAAPRNVLGSWGAVVADLTIQSLGLAAIILFMPLAAWGWHLVFRTTPDRRRMRFLAWPASVILLAAALAALPQPKSWPLPNGLGGIFGDFFMAGAHIIGPFLPDAAVSFVAGLAFLVIGTMLLLFACGTSTSRLIAMWAPRSGAAGEWANASLGAAMHVAMHTGARLRQAVRRGNDSSYEDPEGRLDESEDEEAAEPERRLDADGRIEPSFGPAPIGEAFDEEEEADDITSPGYRITRLNAEKKKKKHTGLSRANHSDEPYESPSTKLLQQPKGSRGRGVSDEVLQENARELEGVLQDFGVKGEITNVRPGPVVTLYELEPAPGTKSSRVIGLADDIARSMSAVAARVAVVPGRNVIGIELPNDRREIVVLREMIEFARFRGDRRKAGAGAGQEYRRRADHRRSGAHAASAHRRHHRLGKVGRHQHHDLVAALPAVARSMQIHHDRSEDARAFRL